MNDSFRPKPTQTASKKPSPLDNTKPVANRRDFKTTSANASSTAYALSQKNRSIESELRQRVRDLES